MNTRNDDDMPRKIIRKLVDIIREDGELKEFSFIPSDPSNGDVNVCPVRYNRTEHCLALESWCVKHVFKHAQREILKTRRRIHADLQRLDANLITALLINPDVTTFWNVRRELVKSRLLTDRDFEFRVSRLVLSGKCKSFEAFAYRRWLLDKARFTEDVYDCEMEVLNRTTVSTANNYHAWNHRIWLFEQKLDESMRAGEVAFSEKWICTHPSEHSGFHYRQHVLKTQSGMESLDLNPLLDYNLLDDVEENFKNSNARYLTVLIHELTHTLPILHTTYPGHESIWYHRRFVFSDIHATLKKIYAIKKNVIRVSCVDIPSDTNIVHVDDELVKVDTEGKSWRLLEAESSVLFKTLLEKERVFLGTFNGGDKALDSDVEHVHKYKKWLRCVLGLSFS